MRSAIAEVERCQSELKTVERTVTPKTLTKKLTNQLACFVYI